MASSPAQLSIAEPDPPPRNERCSNWQSCLFSTVLTVFVLGITIAYYVMVSRYPSGRPRRLYIEGAKTYNQCDNDNEFQCLDGKGCLPFNQTCDFSRDCSDGSDERGCDCSDYLGRTSKDAFCDSYPDCRDWKDEDHALCSHCRDDMVYCPVSRDCILPEQVCDLREDCEFGEDEADCLALFKGNTIKLREAKRSVMIDSGLVATKFKGVWRPICVNTWSKDLNNALCYKLGRRNAVSFKMIDPSSRSDLNIFQILTEEETTRSAISRLPDHSSPEQVTTTDTDPRNRGSTNCSFVETVCEESPICGQVDLRPRNDSVQADGMNPWHATLYKNGDYLCGATLVHKQWLLTSSHCSDQLDLSGQDVVMARLGGTRDQFWIGGRDQVRRVVYSAVVPDTSITLLMLHEPVTLNEHVNTVCVPSTIWIPINEDCSITGRQQGVLDYAYGTKVVGVCQYESEDKFKLCTHQKEKASKCLDDWSGALVCPDASGVQYAVGIYHSKEANCDSDEGQIPAKFEQIITPGVRKSMLDILQSAPEVVAEEPPCPTHQCPLGKCLEEVQICDAIPHCGDLSDETICGR